MKEKAIEILEEYANAYSDFDVNTLTDILTEIKRETAREFAQELIKHFEEQKKRYDMCIDQRRKDFLKLSENEQELREYTIRCEGKENGQWVAADKSVEYINKLLKEKYGVEVEE